MNSMKRQKDMTLKDELPRSVGAQYATGEEWRNNSRKNEETEPKQKQCPVVGMTDDGSKVRCYKEQYGIGTWNDRSMNQGKLEVVKQEMARVSINILGIIEPFSFSFFSITGWGMDLDYRGIEWFALEMNRENSVIFEIASKDCILDSFVDHYDYSIFSKGFLPTVVNIMVI